MLSALLSCQSILYLLFFSDLGLDNLKLFLSILLCDLLFDHMAMSISFVVFLKCKNSLILRFTLHDCLLLLSNV